MSNLKYKKVCHLPKFTQQLSWVGPGIVSRSSLISNPVCYYDLRENETQAKSFVKAKE